MPKKKELPKENPFLKLAAKPKPKKPNPFLAKASDKPPALITPKGAGKKVSEPKSRLTEEPKKSKPTVDELNAAREAKRLREERERPKELKARIKDLVAAEKAAYKEHEAAAKEEKRLYERLDKLKDPNTELYQEIARKLELAEVHTNRTMATALSTSALLRRTRSELDSIAA